MPIIGSAQLVNVNGSGGAGVSGNPVGPVETGVFEADAFQEDAFQISAITAGITGWSGAIVVKQFLGVPGQPVGSGIWGRSESFGVRGAGLLMPYQSPGWKYQIVARNALPGFQAIGYDDSAWPTGTAGFGSGGACPLQSKVGTTWPVNTDCLLRKVISIPGGGVTNVRIWLAIDNDAYVYWNEVGVFQTGHENCPAYDDFSFVVPDAAIVAGDNVLAVRAIDRGVESFVDLRLAATVA